MAARYGPKNEDTPAVAQVYGNFGPGTIALRNEIRDSLTSAEATPDDYKSPAQRKLEAEKTATAGGQTIVEEAKAREEAAASATGNGAEVAQRPDNFAGEDKPIDAAIAALL